MQFVADIIISNSIILLLHSIGLAYVGRVGSALVTVSISIERHLAIGHPTTIAPYKVLFWAPIVFAIVYNIPKFFELAACDVTELNEELSTYGITTNNTSVLFNYNHESKTGDDQREFESSYFTNATIINSNNSTENSSIEICDQDGMRATPLRQNEWYIIFYVVVSKVVLVEVVPWLTVIALNIWTWRKMVLFQRKREAMLKRGKKGK